MFAPSVIEPRRSRGFGLDAQRQSALSGCPGLRLFRPLFDIRATFGAPHSKIAETPGDQEVHMRIAVIGAGGIGAIYGASLAAAGAEVVFVARGPHLSAMRENGLRVEGDRGHFHLQPVQATDDPAAIGLVDYILFAVKLWDVESAGEQIRRNIGAGTAVIPLQNGVDAAERLVRVLGPAPVMGGTAFVTGAIVEPGIVRQTGAYQRMTFGELDGSDSERGRRLQNLCEAAGFEGVFSADVMVPIWEKFLLLVPLAGLNALTRLPLGKWRADPDLMALFAATLRETAAVGHAEGVRLPTDAVDKALATMWSMPDYHMTSMGNDLLRGNRLELPWFAGKVVELGHRHRVATPANAFIFAALKLYANGAPG
jgi:2-dehydropantoate 2-reductase